MYAYHITPIDFRWELLLAVREVASKLAEHDIEAAFGCGYAATEFKVFMKKFAEAQELAKKVGWEGDFRNDPAVLTLPMDASFVYGFVWKQDNNGNCFVVSPYPLPWLKDVTMEELIV